MWGSLLGLSLLIALNPLLFGVILVIISRPRPVQNLFAYWVGTLVTNLPAFLVPLVLLQVIPTFESFAQGMAEPASQAAVIAQPIPFGTGVLAVSIAVVIGVRLQVQRRELLPTTGGDVSSGVVDDSTASTGSPRPQSRSKDAAMRLSARIRGLFSRLSDAWESGSVWISLVFGMLYMPSLSLVLLIGTTIAASGAGIGTQVSAAIVFILGFLAVVEITLVSYVVAPAKTEAVLRPVHQWARNHNRQILIAFFLVLGLWQLAKGFGVA